MRSERAVEPDLVIWENFGVKKKSLVLRQIMFILIALLVLTGCFFALLTCEIDSRSLMDTGFDCTPLEK